MKHTIEKHELIFKKLELIQMLAATEKAKEVMQKNNKQIKSVKK